jgi:hypothetical protein
MAQESRTAPTSAYDAFLSHSHADADWVEALARKLEDEAGLTVWLDRWTLVPGEPWRRTMARGLDDADAFHRLASGIRGVPPGRRSRR